MFQKNILIVGLGNPGAKYENTRHNIGFRALDSFVASELGSANWKTWKDDKSQYIKTEFLDNTVFLLKPLTYMNKSGEVLGEFARFFKIKTSEIIIIYDDISLDLGTVRIRKTGSACGHNGVKDIIRVLGTQDFLRIKIGVGPKPHKDMDTSDFVLSKFSKDQQTIVNEMLVDTKEAVVEILKNGTDTAMNTFN